MPPLSATGLPLNCALTCLKLRGKGMIASPAVQPIATVRGKVQQRDETVVAAELALQRMTMPRGRDRSGPAGDPSRHSRYRVVRKAERAQQGTAKEALGPDEGLARDTQDQAIR
jgi:hypothetical protein